MMVPTEQKQFRMSILRSGGRVNNGHDNSLNFPSLAHCGLQKSKQIKTSTGHIEVLLPSVLDLSKLLHKANS